MTDQAIIERLTHDNQVLRSALLRVVGATDRDGLLEIKKGLEAMSTLGLGDKGHIETALVGVQALLDTDR